MKQIIYFDNAATSWPKPEGVHKAMDSFMRQVGANPGRSGHSRSIEAGRIVYETREAVAGFFGLKDSSRVIFAANATHALNIAFKGLLKKGDHVITSSVEHNSVMRPLRHLEKSINIKITVIPCANDGTLSADSLARYIRKNTKLVVVTHASNVIGTLIPIREIGRICHRHNVLFLVDTAQTAGTIPLDMTKDNIDLLAFTGHKGLMGPQGIGGLCLNKAIELAPLMQGGTGSNSESETHPGFLPDKLESGTLNTVGIAGLGAGIKFIQEQGIDKIREHEKGLIQRLLTGLSTIKGIKIYGPRHSNKQIAVVSFNIRGIKPCDLGYALDRQYGIMTRVGLHCAPSAHKTMRTFPQGTVRLSLSYFNTSREVDSLLKALTRIARGVS